MIREARPEDAEAMCRIYNHYVINTIITFEEEPISLKEMKDRIVKVTRTLPWLVWEENGTVNGYAYASNWKTRSAYRFSVESTIYLHPDVIGRGLGRKLYASLLSELRSRFLHCVIGVIALPNESSVALHERLGFQKVAHFKEVGWKFNHWIDVGCWQLARIFHDFDVIDQPFGFYRIIGGIVEADWGWSQQVFLRI
jgi:L-amino acid N-acyltransferase YncA